MSTKNWIESGVSLFSGAAIGAAVMYLFDPSLGDERRRRAREAAEEAVDAAHDRLGNSWNAVASKAQDYGHDVVDTANDWKDRAGRAVSAARSSASDYASDTRGRARSYGRDAAKQARGYASDARGWLSSQQPGPSAGTVASMALGSVGALALGAGLMYLLDPAAGNRRRAYFKDKAVSAARETQHYAEEKAHAIGDKAQNLASQARDLVGQAKEKVAGVTTAQAK